ncbi:MAG: 5-formyltetrahydrofolate cyclo-ligase [Bacillota bacterium]|nr:5-formyltetrahydrofolate cyclo-ligase [Bacillota bacterium]
MLSRRRALSPAERDAKSLLLARHFLGSSLYGQLSQRRKALMGYLALGDEADVGPILARAAADGLKVAVPRIDGGPGKMVARELWPGPTGWLVEKGPFGVLQPPLEAPEVPLGEIGLILVPAVAVDEGGYRLGYGKGYYDRFLSREGRPFSLAVAFRLQVLPSLPRAPWDIPCHGILTEEGLRILPIPG